MKSIDLRQLEDKLNEIRMDDTYHGYRPAHAVAQLYCGRNDVSVEELNQIEAALDQLVQEKELDQTMDGATKMYRSQKFGSKRQEYMTLLERRAEEKERVREAALRFEALVAEEAQPFFERDYAWYVETA